MALFETNSFVNQQINRMRGYDLVVLQYGLNVMTAEVHSYNSYAKTLAHIIRYTQQCFPGASILVMGVGDRSKMQNGQFITMPSVHGMIKAQRKAAKETGVAFWNTFEAMGGENSMVAFVEKKWASQDHTHIRFPGGKFIAKELAAALIENADANVSDSENQPMPFLHDLESEYEPFPSEEGWQHDNLLLPHEESDQTQATPTPRREFYEDEEESIAETSAHDTTVDTLIKNPSIDLDTSAIQSIEGDTLHLQNKGHKSSGNRAGHKHKDTLSATATESRSHAHREKANQGAASQPANPLNNDNKEQSRTPRPEPQTDGIQTTES